MRATYVVHVFVSRFHSILIRLQVFRGYVGARELGHGPVLLYMFQAIPFRWLHTDGHNFASSVHGGVRKYSAPYRDAMLGYKSGIFTGGARPAFSESFFRISTEPVIAF